MNVRGKGPYPLIYQSLYVPESYDHSVLMCQNLDFPLKFLTDPQKEEIFFKILKRISLKSESLFQFSNTFQRRRWVEFFVGVWFWLRRPERPYQLLDDSRLKGLVLHPSRTRSLPSLTNLGPIGFTDLTSCHHGTGPTLVEESTGSFPVYRRLETHYGFMSSVLGF